MSINKHFKILLLACSFMLLPGCIGGVWTGAGLIYDRHSALHSFNDIELNAITNHALYEDDLFQCPTCHIELAVFNGDILLAGHVETTEMREEAYKRVEKARPDYRRLFKFISVTPFRTHIARDSWITAKIRSQIMADSEISPRTFKIVTADQVVYLMGDVAPDQADWVISIARKTSGVLRVVKLLKYYHLTDQASLKGVVA